MGFDKFKSMFHFDREGDDEGYDDEYYDEYDELGEFDDIDEPDEPKTSFKDRLKSKASKKTTTTSYDDYDEFEGYDDKYDKLDNHDKYDKYEAPAKTEKKEKTLDFTKNKNKESRVISMTKSSSFTSSSGQIFMLKPKKIDDAKSAVDALMSGQIVILNLEGISLELAQSVTDFISGASYCMAGNFNTISQNVFVYTPNGVNLTGAFEDDLMNSGM